MSSDVKHESKPMPPSPKSAPMKIQLENEDEATVLKTTTAAVPANNIFTDAAREALPTDNNPALDRALHDAAADMSRRASATEAQSSLRDSIASLAIDGDDQQPHPPSRSLPGLGLPSDLQNLSDEELRDLAENLSRVLGESLLGSGQTRADVLRRLLALDCERTSLEEGLGSAVGGDGADSTGGGSKGEEKEVVVVEVAEKEGEKHEEEKQAGGSRA
ncbi:hypothetical protein M406DRAFT_69965 [Cryphonectria parasitica EP155]|uniref:Uncharacterized protein n=1 Tax=Cryphonectria parasitica (strain ATCC 38755 / EP155) TaxID=660469 RepID=A0A9P5CR40_CRYP1|nr:uncharacterized protein M406DRAFT_69965 [Cryphonectria parasitica EP155]KAF3767853.1 hypothetical protein M406DRAFT_69965 [Cryphonectria parasitica EP155]